MKIAFYRAKFGTACDKGIAFATFSRFSHCEIVLSNGECWSSSLRDGGVRGKYIELGDHWEVFDIVGEFDEHAIKYWFFMHDDDEYDLLGAVGSLFHIDLSNENKKFCSYACSIVLGLDPIITPGALYNEMKKLKMID